MPSCSTGTSHAAKQDRARRGRSRHRLQPFLAILDPRRIGLAGHSYGAAGVSYIAQWDPRVKAVVAWDNLGAPDPSRPSQPGPIEQPCPATPAARAAVPITKPASASRPTTACRRRRTLAAQPAAKTTESRDYSEAGVDTGELIIRGGTHLDFDFIPNAAFGASLRGADLITWYTTAWFDKYVKGDPAADRRLLTTRWRDDASEAGVDPHHDGNMFSFYYQSRLDIHCAAAGCSTARTCAPAARGWRPTASRRPTPTWRSTPRSTRGPSRRTPRGERRIYPKTAGLPSSVG